MQQIQQNHTSGHDKNHSHEQSSAKTLNENDHKKMKVGKNLITRDEDGEIIYPI